MINLIHNNAEITITGEQYSELLAYKEAAIKKKHLWIGYGCYTLFSTKDIIEKLIKKNDELSEEISCFKSKRDGRGLIARILNQKY